jgi:hypothetical protein
MGNDLMLMRHRAMMESPQLVTATGNPVSFTAQRAGKIKSCAVGFAPTQSGSGTPSPSNVRPISGWTGINLMRTGKNLFNILTADMYDSHIRNDSGTVVSDGGNSYTRGLIPVRPSTTYTLSGFADKNSYSKCVYMLKADGSWIRRTEGFHDIPSYTFTTDSNCYYIQLQLQRASIDSMSGIQIELGSTATAYEAYNGTTIPVSWQSEAGTVYGGTLDIVSGLLTVDRFGFDGTMLQVVTVDRYDETVVVGQTTVTVNGFPAIASDLIASRFTTAIASGAVGRMARAGNQIYFIMSRADYTGTPTADGVITWLSEHPTTFCYKIVPITYQLTPQTIKTLKGINNVWSDANGIITLNYWN